MTEPIYDCAMGASGLGAGVQLDWFAGTCFPVDLTSAPAPFTTSAGLLSPGGNATLLAYADAAADEAECVLAQPSELRGVLATPPTGAPAGPRPSSCWEVGSWPASVAT